MSYKEITPSNQVSKFVKCYWVLEQEKSELPKIPETILPDGCPEIIFNLAAPFIRHQGGETEIHPRAIVVGQIRQHVLVEPTGTVRLFGIRFMPAGIYPLLRQSVCELTDTIESIDVVFGKIGKGLKQRILEAPSTDERIALVEQAFAGHFEKSQNGQISLRASEMISETKGHIRIEELVSRLGTNTKNLERYFNREIGVTPKFFCRITRLQNVLKLLNGSNIDNWADVAYSFGYVDQSHFIKDFRGFAGVSPKAFANQQNSMSDSFVG